MQCLPYKPVELKGELVGNTITVAVSGFFVLGFFIIGTMIGMFFTKNPALSMFIGTVFAINGIAIGVPFGLWIGYAYMEYRTYGHLVKD